MDIGEVGLRSMLHPVCFRTVKRLGERFPSWESFSVIRSYHGKIFLVEDKIFHRDIATEEAMERIFQGHGEKIFWDCPNFLPTKLIGQVINKSRVFQ